MKKIIIVLLLVSISAYAGTLPMSFDQKAIFLKSLKWTLDTTAYVDTLTCTGTLQYSEPFQLDNGYLTFYGKCAYSSAAADTDTVAIILFNSSRSTTDALRWVAVDSVDWGGRADTLYKRKVFNLAGKYGIWWRLGFKKRMGVPKILDKARNSQ